MKSLQRQLEAARREHRDSVQEANRQWQARLTEALSDYDRLKVRPCIPQYSSQVNHVYIRCVYSTGGQY